MSIKRETQRNELGIAGIAPDPVFEIARYQTDIRRFSGLACRIHFAVMAIGTQEIRMQRHVWYPSTYFPKADIRIEDWIDSSSTNPTGNMGEVSEFTI